ncbi:hypothetical protein PNH50_14485 [Leisingera aquaemixtae]|uniref:hypothetical protein n=1 Tax=Leisingera aquaemixtae TaxID=1396826 RepID=UPI0021A85600|nr:hypothetical protein [Leisingera aquaemixtae]UWQ24141.1 hypothetical protein K3553_14415 [Leisingera aquaemixtae]
MAWVSSVIGAVGALGLLLAAVFLGGWPVWLAVLLYPFEAALLAFAVIASLAWRSSRSSAKASQRPDKPQGLGQRPF